jgi:hypothetical protein
MFKFEIVCMDHYRKHKWDHVYNVCQRCLKAKPVKPVTEIDRLREENDELRHLLKEQLKISGKCCYAKAPAYAQIRQKLFELGYGPEIITEILGEEL